MWSSAWASSRAILSRPGLWCGGMSRGSTAPSASRTSPRRRRPFGPTSMHTHTDEPTSVEHCCCRAITRSSSTTAMIRTQRNARSRRWRADRSRQGRRLPATTACSASAGAVSTLESVGPCHPAPERLGRELSGSHGSEHGAESVCTGRPIVRLVSRSTGIRPWVSMWHHGVEPSMDAGKQPGPRNVRFEASLDRRRTTCMGRLRPTSRPRLHRRCRKSPKICVHQKVCRKRCRATSLFVTAAIVQRSIRIARQ